MKKTLRLPRKGHEFSTTFKKRGGPQKHRKDKRTSRSSWRKENEI